MKRFLFILLLTAAIGLPIATQAQLNYSCDFESDTEVANWTFVNGSEESQWYIGTPGAHSGTRGLYVSADGGTTSGYADHHSIVHAYREVTLTEAGYAISFDWKNRGRSSLDLLRVFLAPANTNLMPGYACVGNNTHFNNTEHFSLEDVGNGWVDVSNGILYNQTEWQHFTNDFHVTQPGTYILLFEWVNNSINAWQTSVSSPVCIDNIELTQLSCARPGAIIIPSMSATHANLTWSSVGNVSAWEVDCIHGATHNRQIVYSTHTILNGLTPSTTYDVAIRAICGEGDTGWAQTTTITTLCPSLPEASLPIIENFNNCNTDYDTPIRSCWHRSYYYNKNNPIDPGLPYIMTDPYNQFNGNQYLKLGGIRGFTAIPRDSSYVALPRIDVAVKDLSLTFEAIACDPAALIVGVMTNPYDIATLIPYDTLDFVDSTCSEIHNMEVEFSGYNGPQGNIALYCPPENPIHVTPSAFNVDIDNLMVRRTPCKSVANLTASPRTDAVVLSWTNRGTATTWEISYLAEGDSTPTLLTTQSNPYTVEHLTPGTTYQFTVRAVCQPSVAVSLPKSITINTVCTPTPVPYAEDFNSYIPSEHAEIDPCWYRKINDDYATYPNVPADNFNNIDETNYLEFYGRCNFNDPTKNRYSYAALPLMDANISDLLLTLQARRSDDPEHGSYLKVGVMTDPNDINTFIPFRDIPLSAEPLHSIHNFEIDFAHYNGPEGHIALYCPNGSPEQLNGVNSIFVDNIGIEWSACRSIQNLTARPTPNAVELAWNERNGATQWELTYEEEGSNNTVTQTISTNPYTVTGLTPATNYTFSVRPLCGNNEVNALAQSITLRTQCNPVELPFMETFNNYAMIGEGQPLPGCWYKWSNYKNYFPYIDNRPDRGFHDSQYLLFFGETSYYDQGETEFYSYAALPLVDTTVNSVQISFQVRKDPYPNPDEICYFEVGVMTIPTDISTFVPYHAFDLTNMPAGAVHNVEVNFEDYTGAEGNIAIYCPGRSPRHEGMNFVYVDNVVLEANCKSIKALTATAKPREVEVRWVDNNGTTQWELTYEIDDDDDATTATVLTVNSTQHTVTGLTPNTDYLFTVRPLCTGTITAMPKSVRARTTCEYVTLPYFEDFNTSSPSDLETIAACWHKGTNNYNGSPRVSDYLDGAIDGTNYVWFQSDIAPYATAKGSYCYAALPLIDHVIDELQMSFEVKMGPYANDLNTASCIEVGVMTNPNDITTFQSYRTICLTGQPAGSLHNVEVDFADYTGPYGHLALLCQGVNPNHVNDYVTNDVYVDNVLVEANCKVVKELTATAGSNSVVLTWSDGNHATQWELTYEVADDDETTTATTMTVNSNSVTINGLATATTYRFSVRPFCSGEATTRFRTITATTVDIIPITITAVANDPLMGSVAGSGTYNYGAEVTISATAAAHYHFVAWNDGDTHAVRTITVTEDATYTATFAADQHTISVVANEAMAGTVVGFTNGSGTYNYGTEVTISATAAAHYHFVAWNDGDTHAVRTITVTGDATYTATFATDQHTISCCVLKKLDSSCG